MGSGRKKGEGRRKKREERRERGKMEGSRGKGKGSGERDPGGPKIPQIMIQIVKETLDTDPDR